MIKIMPPRNQNLQKNGMQTKYINDSLEEFITTGQSDYQAFQQERLYG